MSTDLTADSETKNLIDQDDDQYVFNGSYAPSPSPPPR